MTRKQYKPSSDVTAPVSMREGTPRTLMGCLYVSSFLKIINVYVINKYNFNVFRIMFDLKAI